MKYRVVRMRDGEADEIPFEASADADFVRIGQRLAEQKWGHKEKGDQWVIVVDDPSLMKRGDPTVKISWWTKVKRFFSRKGPGHAPHEGLSPGLEGYLKQCDDPAFREFQDAFLPKRKRGSVD